MSQLVSNLFESFKVVVGDLASGINTGFNNLIYVDPSAADPVFSPLVEFIFTVGGIGLGVGILFGIFGLVKRRGK